MVNNQKGSILSVAIIVIVILSFSITTATAYTANVATRTNTVVEQKSDTVLGETLIRQSIAEFKEFIDDLGPQSFTELDSTFSDTAFIEYLYSTYDVVVTVNESYTDTNGNTTARVYRFSYTKPTGETIFKDLYVTLGETDDPTEGIVLDETIDDQITQILNDSETLQSFCDGSDDADTCIDDLEAAVVDGGNEGSLDGDVFVGTDFDMMFDAVTGTLYMNGYTLIVDGNLDLSNIERLEGPGLIFVTGDLVIEQKFAMEINDVLMMVGGHTRINLTHKQDFKRVIQGDTFAIVSYDVADYVGYDSSFTFANEVTYVNNTYYNHVNDDPVFRYLGDESWDTYGDLLTLFEQFSINVTGAPVNFNYNESEFDTE